MSQPTTPETSAATITTSIMSSTSSVATATTTSPVTSSVTEGVVTTIITSTATPETSDLSSITSTSDSSSASTTNLEATSTSTSTAGARTDSEHLARYFALGLFVFLAIAAVVAFASWFLQRSKRRKANRPARDPESLPGNEKPKPNGGAFVNFPNASVSPAHRPKGSFESGSQTRSPSQKSTSASPKSPARGRSNTAPILLKSRRNTASSEFTLPSRSNTSGSVAPKRPSSRPPPLDLSLIVPESGVGPTSPSSIHSGRSVFYTQNCPSPVLTDSEHRQTGRSDGRLDIGGDEDIMQYYPHTAPSSPLGHEQTFSRTPVYPQAALQHPTEPLSYAHIKELVRPGPYS